MKEYYVQSQRIEREQCKICCSVNFLRIRMYAGVMVDVVLRMAEGCKMGLLSTVWETCIISGGLPVSVNYMDHILCYFQDQRSFLKCVKNVREMKTYET